MQVKHRIECLDGLRGLAAMWVILGHACILTGRPFPIVDEPDLGVDLFVILSGFLMTFHYQLAQAREPWGLPSTWVSFWKRRFFRVAPLYYVLLLVALAAGPLIYEARMVIDAALQHAPQEASRYVDSSPANVFLHLSFLFGLLPEFAFRTPLPDWSLGLEMQFYAAFPGFMLIAHRFGWPRATLLIAAVSCSIAALLHFAGVVFPMPSLLLLKIPFFLAGMLTAAALGRDRRSAMAFLGLALFLAAIPITDANISKTILRLAIVLGFYALVHYRHIGRTGSPIAWVSTTLGYRPFRWLGDRSYGVYLWHLLIMQPVAAWTFLSLPEVGRTSRFVLVCVVVIPATYALATLTYRLIELPGLTLGKRFDRSSHPKPERV